MKVQLDRLNAIGGLKSVVPSEGITFVYKNKLDRFNQEIKEFPIILFGNEDEVEVFLSRKDINNTENIESLINKINLKLEMRRTD